MILKCGAYTMGLILAAGGLLFASFQGICQTPINQADTIIIGGIKQYVTLKGIDKTKPIFLFLHGGPGGSVMEYAQKFTDRLQQHFVVVQWDQRETGKTLALNPSTEPLSFERFGQDTRILIDTLLKRFHQPKLYLAGHSWGTALGFYIAANYPDRLYAYIAISPMVNQLESERMALDLMKHRALEKHDTAQLKVLKSIHIPFLAVEDIYQHRRNLFLFNNQQSVLKTFSKSYAAEWSHRWLSVWNEASAINLQQSLQEIRCPVYFFTGAKDIQTNVNITRAYYGQVKAPQKDLFEFPDVGHGVPTARPSELQQMIIEKILPATYNSSHAMSKDK